MRRTRAGLKLATVTALAALSVSLAGCSDGVDLNGKIFDAMGISPSAQANNKRESRVAERAPLVMPPNAQRLPEPGEVQTAAISDPNWPVDPDQKKVLDAAERERLHREYCSGARTWRERAFNPNNSKAATSPFGSCNALVGASSSDIGKDDKPADPLARALSTNAARSR